MKAGLIILLGSFLMTVHASGDEIQYFDEGPLAGKGFPFSESVRVGKLLFLSGAIGSDENGRLVEGGLEAEAMQTMKNIQEALERRGLALSDVVKCTIFLDDIGQWNRFNKVYVTFFEAPYPARSALGADGLALNASVEIECIAAYP